MHNTAQATLTGGGEPERVQVARVTPSLARVLRVSPALGRWFSEEEGVPGAATVAVLSHGLWLRRFGGDPGAVGRTVTINGVQAPVVGVMPASFSFPAVTPLIDMWLPAQSSSASASFLFQVMGVARLRDGVSAADARAELTQLLEDLARTAPRRPRHAARRERTRRATGAARRENPGGKPWSEIPTNLPDGRPRRTLRVHGMYS